MNTGMNIGVLASHAGSTLQAVLDAIANGRLDARVSIVISNNSGSGALLRASEAGIPTAHISGTTHPHDTARDVAIRDILQAHQVDLVLLAGYMKPIGLATQTAFAGRIINTHPSLLPKFGGTGFYGLKVHAAVIAAGELESGATVHHVSGSYDTGAIIAQQSVAVVVGDTPESLQERVKAAEQTLLLNVLADWSAKTKRTQRAATGVAG
jgi:phosphoribosylglycinamide formyltransferase 1